MTLRARPDYDQYQTNHRDGSILAVRVQRPPLEEEVHVSPAPMSQKYSTISAALAVGDDEPDRNLALELVRLPRRPPSLVVTGWIR